MDDKVREKMITLCNSMIKFRREHLVLRPELSDIFDEILSIMDEQDLVDRRPTPKPKPLTWDEAKENLEDALDHMEAAHSGYASALGYDEDRDSDVQRLRGSMDQWPASKADDEDEQLTRNQRS